METTKIAPVILYDYDLKWADMFETEKSIILEAIGEHIISIEHFGSTSIPGMVAKSEIDILIGVSDLADVIPCVDKLKSIDYLYYPRFEEFEPMRRYFRKSDGIVPLVHVHVYEVSSEAYEERIMFRDYLRAHPDTAAAYAAHKKFLIETGGDDRGAYSDAKSTFVTDIMKKIRKEA